jgi:hypothetical protein
VTRHLTVWMAPILHTNIYMRGVCVHRCSLSQATTFFLRSLHIHILTKTDIDDAAQPYSRLTSSFPTLLMYVGRGGMKEETEGGRRRKKLLGIRSEKQNSYTKVYTVIKQSLLSFREVFLLSKYFLLQNVHLDIKISRVCLCRVQWPLSSSPHR